LVILIVTNIEDAQYEKPKITDYCWLDICTTRVNDVILYRFLQLRAGNGSAYGKT